jgi:hypothetical protein
MSSSVSDISFEYNNDNLDNNNLYTSPPTSNTNNLETTDVMEIIPEINIDNLDPTPSGLKIDHK